MPWNSNSITWDNCMCRGDGAHPEGGDTLALQEAAQIVEIRVWQRHPDGGSNKAETQREGTQLAQVRRTGPRFIRPSTRALVYATCQEGPQGLVCVQCLAAAPANTLNTSWNTLLQREGGTALRQCRGSQKQLLGRWFSSSFWLSTLRTGLLTSW